MAEEPLRAAIIGTGRIADLYDEELVDYTELSLPDEVVHSSAYSVDPVSHAASYRSVAGYDLVAAANRGRDRLVEFGARHDVTALYTDYHELLDAEALDVMSVCTPSAAKHDAVVACAEAGVDAVIVEKAFGTSLGEARSMIAACEETGTVLAVNHPMRFSPLFRRLREIVASGTIGELAHVTSHTGGGLVHGSTHDFDLLRFLGGDVAEVDATVSGLEPDDSVAGPLAGTYEDRSGEVRLRFESGATGFVETTTDATMGIVVRGTEGYVTAPRLAGVMTLVQSHTESPTTFGWPEPSPDDGWSGQPVRWEETLPPWPDSNAADERSTTQRLLSELRETIHDDALFVSRGEDGAAALELAIACYVSELTDETVELPVESESLRVRNH